MCNPMAVGMAITAVGTYAQAQAANKSKQAILAAREAERVRQQGLQNESANTFNQALKKQGVEEVEKAMKTATEGRIAAGEGTSLLLRLSLQSHPSAEPRRL